MLRSIARNRAKMIMRKNGMVKICKHMANRRDGKSYFAAHWREFV